MTDSNKDIIDRWLGFSVNSNIVYMQSYEMISRILRLLSINIDDTYSWVVCSLYIESFEEESYNIRRSQNHITIELVI